MKVNLAAQVFSSSVADAIEFCEQNLQLPQFKGSSATVKFIRIFDRLFDVSTTNQLHLSSQQVTNVFSCVEVCKKIIRVMVIVFPRIILRYFDFLMTLVKQVVKILLFRKFQSSGSMTSVIETQIIRIMIMLMPQIFKI